MFSLDANRSTELSRSKATTGWRVHSPYTGALMESRSVLVLRLISVVKIKVISVGKINRNVEI